MLRKLLNLICLVYYNRCVGSSLNPFPIFALTQFNSILNINYTVNSEMPVRENLIFENFRCLAKSRFSLINNLYKP